MSTATIDKRQTYNDLKIALEVFTMLHGAAVDAHAPELSTHRAAVARDIKALLERVELAKAAGV